MNLGKITTILKQNLAKLNKNNFGILEDIKITSEYSDILKARLKQPSLYSFYSSLLALATRETADAENVLDFKFNELFLKYKNEKVHNKKPCTDTHIKCFVYSDIEYINIKKILIDKQEQEKLIQSMVKGLEHKKDMLISIASDLRSEYKIGGNNIDLGIKKLFNKNIKGESYGN